jgi:hypothetical protein
MTGRLPVEPAPGPLEEYATRFDVLFRRARAVAGGVEVGERVAGAVDNALAILESVYRSAPVQRVESAA